MPITRNFIGAKCFLYLRKKLESGKTKLHINVLYTVYYSNYEAT